jgi:hypothetical protein
LIFMTEKGRQIREQAIACGQNLMLELIRDTQAEDLLVWNRVMKQMMANSNRMEERESRRKEEMQMERKLEVLRESRKTGEPG